jgi:hypothetical protein
VSWLALLGLLVSLPPAAPLAAPARPEHVPCRNGYCALAGAGWGIHYGRGVMEATAAYNVRRGLLTCGTT